MHSLYFLILIFSCLVFYSNCQFADFDRQHSISVNMSAITQYINQQDPLEYCQIKGNYRVFYHCRNHTYLMTGGGTWDSKYSISHKILSMIDGDIDSNSIVYVSKTKFDVIRDNIYLQAMTLTGVTPIFVRVKTRPLYIFTAMLSLLDTSAEQIEGLVSKSGDALKMFELQTYLIGVSPNIHYIRFPTDKLNYELTEESFIDVILLNDPFYGKEHIVVALKGGWVYLFRTFFQDSEVETSQAIKLEQNYEILNIVAKELFVVVLMENQENKELKVVLYRVNTYSGPILQHQCDLNLDKKLSEKGYKAELRFKKSENTYLLLVNFPDDEVLTYYFQTSPLGNLVKACPVKASPVDYYQKEYGYSLEYVANEYPGKILEEGILFSPINPHLKTSYFVRYCYPNTFWSNSSGCTPCIDGYSSGGAQPQCLPCILSDKYNMIKSNPMIETCPIVCNEKDKFGPSCLSCAEYMNSMNATLPQGSHWAIDQKGQCSFICDQGSPDFSTGTCISKDDLAVKADHCIQVKDCLNCSLTPSCGWCGGSCKQFSQCGGDILKSSMGKHFLIPALNCNQFDICGKQLFTNSTGKIEFAASTFPKNQICRWDIQPEVKSIYTIDLIIHSPGKGISEASTPPTLHTELCVSNYCEVLQLALDQEVISYSFNVTDILFLLWTDHTIPNAMSFKIEYKMNKQNMFEIDFTDTILSPFRWLISLISICLITSCLILSLQKLQTHIRRRRLLIELQDLGQFDHEDTELATIDVDELFSNNRVINMMIYDQHIANDFQQTECSICLDEFKQTEPLAKIVACKHIFHVKCFEDWARSVDQQMVKCPICNRELI